MIRVRIAAQLFEQCLKSGYKTGYLLEIIQGLPMDCQLIDASFDKQDGTVILMFSQPRVPDTQLEDLNISIKSVKANPVDLERTPPIPPKADYSKLPVVERTIG